MLDKKRQETTPCFTWRGWLEEKCMYQSVWVGLPVDADVQGTISLVVEKCVKEW